ncbi:MAG: nucleotidyltransferase domain-containing protein [Acidobacteriota bacterium]|nr:nucleotidyltransferase domain-containing protein [Acidobacteriota bacterium]MDE2965666.1 nucleotidyltransferase domain-containing protein [Acidobacteriota bacterium]
MNVAASDTFISIMVDRIVKGFRPSQVVLFGSHARGAATEWSDVDLLVILPNGTDKRDSAIEIRRILGDLPVCKDIVVATPEEVARRGHMVGTLLRSALRDGKVLYERP